MNIFKEVKEVVKSNPQNYTEFYKEKHNLIEEFVLKYDGVKVDTFIKNFKTELDFIRFSVVFSDLTNIFPVINIPTEKIFNFSILEESKTVTIPLNIYNSLLKDNNQKPILNLLFYNRRMPELKELLTELEPLIEKELVLFHNTKFVAGLKGVDENTNSKRWGMFDVAPTSDAGKWLVMENAVQRDSLPINFYRKDYTDNTELFNVTVPYLKGIPMQELAEVLSDNADLLSSFRKNLKALVDQSKKDKKTLDELKQDIIRPEVDKISAKFKKVQENHRLKTIGTVFGTMCIGLVSLTTTGISQMLSGLLGSTGMGVFAKNEIDFKTEMAKLEELPLFLMWKLKNEKK